MPYDCDRECGSLILEKKAGNAVNFTFNDNVKICISN
jgi:hypothetical protein